MTTTTILLSWGASAVVGFLIGFFGPTLVKRFKQ